MAKRVIKKKADKVVVKEAEIAPIPVNTPNQADKATEQERQKAEFRWEGNIKILKNKLAELDLSSFTLTNLHTELEMLFNSYGTVKGKHIIDKDTKIQLANGVDVADLTLGELMIFIKKRASTQEYLDTGLNFQTLVIDNFNDNPFLHPLAKALNINKLDEEWLETHSFLSPEVYDLINKGTAVETEVGLWNVTLEKAIVDIAEYKKVKKLVYQDGKAVVVSLFANDFEAED